MLITNRRSFALGLGMAISFLLAFGLMLAPFFQGRNAFQAADRFFNSIAKGSTDFFPRLRGEIAGLSEAPLAVSLELPGDDRELAECLFRAGGAEIRPLGSRLEVNGRLRDVARVALDDAECMFRDREGEIAARRGRSGKEVLFAWWRIFQNMEFELKREQRTREAALAEAIRTKGIEVAFNFHGIEPTRIREKAPLVSLLLVSYIAYTAWWGFALLFLAVGLGLRLSAGRKREA